MYVFGSKVMGSKPQIIHEWTEPAKVRIHQAQQLRKRAKVVIPCILVITFVVEAILYLSITILIPQEIQQEMEFPWFRLFRNAFIVCAALASVLYLIMIVATRYLTCTYKVKDNGISFMSGGGGRWAVRWKRIEAYSISQHDDLPQVTMVMLHLSKTIGSIPLPEGDESRRIIETIDSRVPLVDVPQYLLERPHLSRGQWLYISLLMLGYLGLVALFPAYVRYAPWLGALLVLGPMFFGPGTLGFLTLFGKRCFKNIHFKRYAIAINLITLVLIILLLFILGLYLLSREFPPSAS